LRGLVLTEAPDDGGLLLQLIFRVCTVGLFMGWLFASYDEFMIPDPPPHLAVIELRLDFVILACFDDEFDCRSCSVIDPAGTHIYVE